MEGRKLNVSADSPFANVRKMRQMFDSHVDTCADCQPVMCHVAQTQWRALCLEALKSHGPEQPSGDIIAWAKSNLNDGA